MPLNAKLAMRDAEFDAILKTTKDCLSSSQKLEMLLGEAKKLKPITCEQLGRALQLLPFSVDQEKAAQV